jgi:hypothetical protein
MALAYFLPVNSGYWCATQPDQPAPIDPLAYIALPYIPNCMLSFDRQRRGIDILMQPARRKL